MNLALWLKKNRYRADQVQTFLPSPMALATAMYHSGMNPLSGVRRGASESVETVKGLRQRRLHKAFLRYHDPENWPVLREALKAMGRADLIGPGKASARAGVAAGRHGRASATSTSAERRASRPKALVSASPVRDRIRAKAAAGGQVARARSAQNIGKSQPPG